MCRIDSDTSSLTTTEFKTSSSIRSVAIDIKKDRSHAVTGTWSSGLKSRPSISKVARVGRILCQAIKETLVRYLVMAMRTPQFKQSVTDAHKKHLAQLKADGVLELAGPFTDKSGGAYVIAAKDLKAAQRIAFDDPVHTSGSSEVSVYEWNAV